MRKIGMARLALVIASGLLAACDGTTIGISFEPPTPAVGDVLTPAGPTSPAAGDASSTDSASPTPVPADGLAGGEDSDAGAGETTILPADWVPHTSTRYGVTLRHPPGWDIDPAYDERLGGPDGFVQFNAANGPATPMELCEQEAGHVLMPFGSDPRIEPLSVDGMDGCLIIPGGQGADAMGGQQEAVIRYPQPYPVNGAVYQYLLLYADPTNMLPLLVSLRFGGLEAGPVGTPTPLPTLSPLDGDPNTPAEIEFVAISPAERDVPRGTPLNVAWSAQGFQTVVCIKEILINYHARNEVCQQVAMAGDYDFAAPTSEEVFALEVTVEAFGQGLSKEVVRRVQFTCHDDWYLANPPSTCPAYPAFEASAIAQRFEHGWLVYVDSFVSPQKLVFVFFDPPPGFEREPYLVFSAPEPETPTAADADYAPDPHFWPVVQRPEVQFWGQAGEGIGAAADDPVAYTAHYQWEHGGDRPGLHFLQGPDDLIFAFTQMEWDVAGQGIGEWQLWTQP